VDYSVNRWYAQMDRLTNLYLEALTSCPSLVQSYSEMRSPATFPQVLEDEPCSR
jgi:hypothetical protein